MKEQCPTCPFRNGTYPDLAERVTARCLTEASQICHHPVLHGKKETHLCRGARDIQLRFFYVIGFLPEPTDEAWKNKCNELGI
jgi:hypothetical protein